MTPVESENKPTHIRFGVTNMQKIISGVYTCSYTSRTSCFCGKKVLYYVLFKAQFSTNVFNEIAIYLF